MIIADSDILIDALRGREPALSRIREGLEQRSLATTTISAFELLSGAKKAAERKKVETLLAPMDLVDFDDGAAAAAAEIRLELEARGEGIGMADYLIAGICRARSLPLLTRNRNHFERVAGLRLAELNG